MLPGIHSAHPVTRSPRGKTRGEAACLLGKARRCGSAPRPGRAQRRSGNCAAVVNVVVLPFVAITTTYLYWDLQVRKLLKEPKPARASTLPAEA